jgi:hypothetical protein
MAALSSLLLARPQQGADCRRVVGLACSRDEHSDGPTGHQGTVADWGDIAAELVRQLGWGPG